MLNTYATFLTRGIYGTYVYVCDQALRDYLRRYIPAFESGEEPESGRSRRREPLLSRRNPKRKGILTDALSF